MKTYAATLAAAFACFALAPRAADAATWIYHGGAPIQSHVAQPIVVSPVYHSAYTTYYPTYSTTIVPMTRTLTPRVVVAPLGRVRYLTPVRTLRRPVYLIGY